MNKHTVEQDSQELNQHRYCKNVEISILYRHLLGNYSYELGVQYNYYHKSYDNIPKLKLTKQSISLQYIWSHDNTAHIHLVHIQS